MVEQSQKQAEQIPSLPRTDARVFERVFTDGMGLIEEAAAYLDGPGRELNASLSREAGLTYSAWSMELTTRLMQAASWLVMQRSINDGDMAQEEALLPKYRIRRDGPPLDPSAQLGRGLPDTFLELIDRAENLFERICRLDAALYDAPEAPAISAVNDQIAQLQTAAETGVFDPLRVWGKAR